MIRPEHQINAESKRAIAADRLVSKLQEAKVVVSVNVYVSCASFSSFALIKATFVGSVGCFL